MTVSVKDPSLIENGTQAFDLQQTPPKTAGPHANTSGFFNYSVTEGVANVSQTGAFSELGFANETGHATATAAYTQSDFRRGLIAYSQDDERDLRRETIGDELAYSGYLGSSVIVGGVGYSRVFALQPGFIRDPSPALSGTVLTPTQADVYINGALYRTIVLQPGQFSLSNLPVPQGANVTQVVFRDATGQTTDLTAAYYSAQSALRQGVNEYSYHIGFPRLQPFASNDQYGPLAAIGFYRVGVTNEVTLGATFEKMTGDGQVDGGPTLDLRLPFGTLNLASSFSSADHASGFADSIAYTYVSRRFTLSVYDVMRSDDYSTVTLAPQNDRTTSAVGESAGLTLTRRLNVTLSHVDTHYRDESPTDQTSLITNVIANSRATLQFVIERGTGSPLNPTQKNSNAPYWTVGTSLLFNIGSSGSRRSRLPTQAANAPRASSTRSSLRPASGWATTWRSTRAPWERSPVRRSINRSSSMRTRSFKAARQARRRARRSPAESPSSGKAFSSPSLSNPHTVSCTSTDCKTLRSISTTYSSERPVDAAMRSSQISDRTSRIL